VPTKAELEEQAKAAGYETEGLSKAELEELVGEGEKSEQGMDGQSEPYYPQQRRHEQGEA
jgi:hypothetical protein